MQTIGLIGGMSWYSTAEYYRVINEETQARLGGHASAPIALQSLDFAQVRAMQVAGDWAGAGQLLAEAGRRCQDAGAEVLLICTNLMHRVADDVAAAVDIPLLHIADAIADRARRDGIGTVG
ncbi:MAG: amino acid racemase, partial [Actinobacteria bacterium]|nr:amino acid racemase [Actinomycetota bacterium]